MTFATAIRILACLGAFSWAQLAVGQVTFRIVGFDDPQRQFQREQRQILACLQAAAEEWGRHLDGKASIEILFRIDRNATEGRGSGSSTVSNRVKPVGRNWLCEQGMVAEIRTGKDPNRGDADVIVVMHPDYLRTLWFDPEPTKRTAAPAPGKLDAVSVFLHELGHAIAFNGWLDPKSGELRGDAISTYDRCVTFDGRDFWFVGLHAMKVYGGPILLSRTNNNYHHVGEPDIAQHDKLPGDLMNGVVLEYAQRYTISQLDLAMLADCGVPVKRAR